MAAIIQTLILRPPHPKTLPHPTPITSNAIRFCISTHKCSLLLRKPHSVSKSFPITAAQHSAQGDDASQAASSGKALIWAKPLLSFVADNFLPLEP
ncbi:hypothetical protein CK203_034794 [Vitis vinifera]|uniref:Uncharacterized protein n=1 Tax=Vitis vinifera TaxID=29760 RepID=A0A438IC14_VITVI|nr:hypothetical protein CK203_034794 [Vitis vinifera]